MNFWTELIAELYEIFKARTRSPFSEVVTPCNPI